MSRRSSTAGMARMGHFAEWPVTFSGARSLARLMEFVRMCHPVAEMGRCSR
jgi:hypothetical protein